jgi:phage terminase large subunit GpA-like protein
LTAEVLIDPREYEVAGSNKRRGALVKSGERREWRKKPHQPNEALDIVVGARALAWGEGAGQLTAPEWRELAAKAYGAPAGETLELGKAAAIVEAVPQASGVETTNVQEQRETASVAPQDDDWRAALRRANAETLKRNGAPTGAGWNERRR